ncbi:MAG: hypothetical protein NZ807_12750, partial [Dehalococcoidia bacterium]|nr:hypothetical protein [Dehalococcoidia bacterium]
ELVEKNTKDGSAEIAIEKFLSNWIIPVTLGLFGYIAIEQGFIFGGVILTVLAVLLYVRQQRRR